MRHRSTAAVAWIAHSTAAHADQPRTRPQPHLRGRRLHRQPRPPGSKGMKPSYDMELFLTAVLKGAHATRRRHINQARLIQAAIQPQFQRDNPWRWQLKHLQWFMQE